MSESQSVTFFNIIHIGIITSLKTNFCNYRTFRPCSLPASCSHRPRSHNTDRERSSEPRIHKGSLALHMLQKLINFVNDSFLIRTTCFCSGLETKAASDAPYLVCLTEPVCCCRWCCWCWGRCSWYRPCPLSLGNDLKSGDH